MLRVYLCVVLAVAVPAVAVAQDDDWGVKRNPFDKRVVDRWKAVLERDPNDAAALKKLVELYRSYSKVEKLVAEYEARPDGYAKAMILGHLYKQRPDVEKALEQYDKAAALKPGDPTTHLLRAELLRQKQKKPEAAAAYEKALPLARNPKEKKQILRALADLALEDGNLDKARGYFKTYIDLDPSDVTARLELADALAKHGIHDQALVEYQEAEKRLGTDPARRVQVMARIGGELEALKKPEEAVAVYQKAIAAAPRGYFLRKELTERIIDIARKKQDIRGLVAKYEKEWTNRGHFEWDILARLYEEIGEQEKALDAYRRAVAAAPGELDTQKRLIALLDRAGKDAELIQQYEALIRVAPGEPRFQLELAERLWKRGDRNKALAMLARIGASFPDDAGVHAALAELYSRWGEEKLALKEYEMLVRVEPNDDTHLVNLGEQYYQRGDKARALEVWKRIAAAKTPEAFARLGEVFAEHDLGADAIEMYQKALALKPRDPNLWRGLAGVYERQRQDDKALDAWERLMDVTTGDPAQKLARREARTRIISILYRKSGQPLNAKTAEWLRKFNAKPPDMEAAYRLAEAYLKLNQLERAEGILKKILDADPKDLDAKHQLVAVFKSQRKYAEAIALLKQLAVDHPALERQYFTDIAELELSLYHDDEAIAYAQKALEKSPNDAQAQERLAEIYSKKEDYEAAIKAYKRAIELAPRNYKVYHSLAKLYLREGKNEDAAALYREIVRRGSDEETVRSAAYKAIDLQEYLGTLGDLETELAPLAFTPSNKATYRRILVRVYDRYVPPLVARARAGDVAAQKELTRLGEHGLKPLLEALEDASDPEQQKVAVRVLGYLGNKSAAAPLVKLAVEMVSTPAPLPPVPGMAAPANNPDAALDMDLRVEALVAAGRLGDQRVIPQLVGLLNHREVALREAAAWALGQTRSPKAADALVAALKDSRSSVHALACVGLGRIGERRSLDRVAELMKDTSAAVEARAACAYALGLAKSGAHLTALTEVVASGNDDVQLKAAWSLARLGDARAAPALLRAYWGRKQAVREAIVWSLGKIAAGGDNAPLPFEDVTLEAGKIDHRQLVRGLIGSPGAGGVDAGILKGHAADLAAGIGEALDTPGRRDLVVRVLRDLDAADGELALGAFTAVVPDHDRAAVRQVVAAVGAQIAPKIEALCDSKDAEIRQLAVNVNAKLGGANAPARIAAALDDESVTVRLAALASTRRYISAVGPNGAGAPALVAALGKRLAAPSWQERAAAVEALGGIPGADARLVGGALGDTSGFVREAAARALANLKHVPGLITASRDEVAEVRLAAADGLSRAGGAEARARLAELAKSDPDARVRAVATP